MVLTPGAEFHTHRGAIAHDSVIGLPEGSVVKSTNGDPFLVLRPLLMDYVLSMPRGAQVIYPEGRRADRARGRHVPWRQRAGGGRGLRCADVLAAACGRPRGHRHVLRTSRRSRRARRCATSRRSSVSIRPTGTCASPTSPITTGPQVDRAVLDMLAPWEVLEAVGGALGARRRADRLRRDRDAAVADGRGAARAAVLDRAAVVGEPCSAAGTSSGWRCVRSTPCGATPRF